MGWNGMGTENMSHEGLYQAALAVGQVRDYHTYTLGIFELR